MEVTLLGSVSGLSTVSSERRLSNAVFSSLKTNTRRQTYRVTAINSVESKTHHGGVRRIRKNEDGAAVAKVVENPYSEAETASPDLHKSLSDFLEEARDFVGDDDGPPRWFSPLELLIGPTSPVYLSTLEDGKIVRGLEGIPSEGPVLFVGYHMLLGLELIPMITQFLKERNIHLRGLAHPMLFLDGQDVFVDPQIFDKFKLIGGVPISKFSIYNLLRSKSHVLLYPGGIREAFHKKGEEYKLFWPEQPEFVRVASKFGAKIVPFGVVGEDDICDFVLDSDDQMNIPFLKDFMEEATRQAGNIREGDETELGNQKCYLPVILPRIPGRLYLYFGKPIETAGKEQELRDKEKTQDFSPMELTLLGSFSAFSPVPSERRLESNLQRQTHRVKAVKAVASKTHVGGGRRIRKCENGAATVAKVVENPYSGAETASPDLRKSLSDFLEEARDFVGDDDGPPRWFSPLECSSQAQGSPLLLFIPDATSPVYLSTLANGKRVRGLEGIPSEGPVLYVGYHVLLGLEIVPVITQFLKERNIHLRGLAHPMLLWNIQDDRLVDPQVLDKYKMVGAVPVSNFNIYKLLQSKSHALLYPGGIRESFHRKGEEYKLFWPEQPEFVRVASKFGAKIVPFGVVGEDDICHLVLDANDQRNIPILKDVMDYMAEATKPAGNLREGDETELGNQICYLPGLVPKIPGRFYFYFGKPIETAGKEQELKDKDKAQEFYLQVKSEVEQCIAYLKMKRESDPYRQLLPRMMYQASHGFSSEIPTFDL
ncbi:hypothetical protein IGI04_008072 [Brassica rapa subsp. trilocularis]|uniref:Phospholipid/glycerol acyltransferase domain-containing protein n=1 Tax=Brassica rapa subsp. trilocularis TaxID=1813537 RepID=A0ABQ7NLK6_BRACM|nr:hypothetical protein IGI04_008072 [Brassica rapa subsp. trilocularis]